MGGRDSKVEEPARRLTIPEVVDRIEIHVLTRRSGCILHVSTPEALRSLCCAWLEAQKWLDAGKPLAEVTQVFGLDAPRRAA